MKRIALTLAYKGTRYAGWQRQENALAVAQVVEEALKDLTGEAIVVTGASRTDAGVHALGQCAHFDTSSTIPPEKFAYALNTKLPPDIRVVKSKEVFAQFHARFKSLGKRYSYRIYQSPHASATEGDLSWHVFYELDIPLMKRALKTLIGKHDFAAMMATGSLVKDTVREIYKASLIKKGPWVTITLEGNGFLYNMVRIIAGTLVYMSAHKLPEDTLIKMLQNGHREDGGPTAPPQGLTLCKVFYKK